MKRSIHPEAYDWNIKCGYTAEQVDGALTDLVIGIWKAHADLRAAGKLPATSYLKESKPIDIKENE